MKSNYFAQVVSVIRYINYFACNAITYVIYYILSSIAILYVNFN